MSLFRDEEQERTSGRASDLFKDESTDKAQGQGLFGDDPDPWSEIVVNVFS